MIIPDYTASRLDFCDMSLELVILIEWERKRMKYRTIREDFFQQISIIERTDLQGDLVPYAFSYLHKYNLRTTTFTLRLK